MRITLAPVAVRQSCVNGDWPCQWDRAIFHPPQNPHPLTDHQKLVQMIKSAEATAVPNLVQIRPWCRGF